jgi:hypothetical protein
MRRAIAAWARRCGVVRAAVLGDLRQVARALGRDDPLRFSLMRGRRANPERRSTPVRATSRSISAAVEVVHARVVELRRHGAEDRQLVVGLEQVVVALVLLAHVAQRVEAPRLSNLLMAMTSAKSSMSIFSSWVAAPYSASSRRATRRLWSVISVSLWPMPLVSTITRSKPAALQDLDRSRTCLDSARFDCRVASERMYTRGRRWRSCGCGRRAARRRSCACDGSTEMTAMVLSAKSARKRRTSSSTRLDLPAPPVPVTPSTGNPAPAAPRRDRPRAGVAGRGGSRPAVMSARQRAADRGPAAPRAAAPVARRRRLAHREVALAQQIVDHALQAHRAAVVGRVDPRDAVRVQLAISDGRMVPPPPPKIRMSPRRARAAGRACT